MKISTDVKCKTHKEKILLRNNREGLVMEEDGSIINYYFHKKESKPNLEQLQKMVGGYIEVVTSLDSKYQIVIDEEGKLKGKPFNKDATALLGYGDDELVGDAVILSGKAKLD